MPGMTRPATLARHGMVSSPHYLASGAGMRVLQDGGSAVDAAIATCATLGVVYPHMTGVGGDAFWLIYEASTQKLHALNGSGRAASQATPAFFRSRGYDTIPSRGPMAALTVPGAVDSWCSAHDRFGRIPLSQALAPAISYARDGHAVCPGLERWSQGAEKFLNEHDRSREVYLPHGRPSRACEVLYLPDLARTMEAVAERGRDGFYEGPVADAMVKAVQEAGGVLQMDDLASHRSDWVEPISTTYRGYTCYQHPPNSAGFSLLSILNILEGFELGDLEEDGVDYLHLVVEATKLAFAGRNQYLTDPEFREIPLGRLLSKEYAEEMRALIDLGQSLPQRNEKAVSGDTVCVVAADEEGNTVSTIQSLYEDFGSGFVAGETGILLQNRGSFFSLNEDQANCLEPGKRTFHTLMPAMLFKDGRPSLVYGTMGGEGQAQTQAAVVTRVVDFGHDIQSAIDLPRWVQGRTIGAATSDLRVEGRFPPEVVEALRARGHAVRVLGEWDDTMGHAQGISLDYDQGVLTGGSDPRGDGTAVGW